MYNQAIISAPVCLFLGAGSSKPFGKMLMHEFVFHLKDKQPFVGESLFSEIIEASGGDDLEHIFQELEEWLGKDYEPLRKPSAILIPNLFLPKDQVEARVGQAARLLMGLRREVFNAYRDIAGQSKQRLLELFGRFFDTIFERLDPKKNPLVIFTTNYDPAIETFCQAKSGEYILCDGFVQQPNAGSPVWHRESIDNLQMNADPRKHVVLFKLHGSTSWYKTPSGIIKSDVPVHTVDDPNIENLLIYPAKRKVALEDPYFTAYDYFQRTLEHQGPEDRSKLCIVIGYSFRDYDALSRLRSAISYNTKVKLMVIDPHAKELCARLKTQGVTAEPIPQLFSLDSGISTLLSDDHYIE